MCYVFGLIFSQKTNVFSMRTYDEIFKQVLARYRCPHVEIERRNKPDKNGRPLVAWQCVTCGERVGKIVPVHTLRESELRSLPLWNRELEQAYWRQMLGEAYQRREGERSGDMERWRRKYAAYLATS